MRWALVVVLLAPAMAQAETLVATRLLRATEIIGPGDVMRQAGQVAGAATQAEQVVGLEARVAIYPGRPVRLSDLGPAAVIERNEVVRMVYREGGLMILSEGRALARGGLDDTITVMNLGSRQSVQAVVRAAGLVEVGRMAGAAGSGF